MSTRKYSPAELDFLREGYKGLALCDLTVAFNEMFNTERTETQIRHCLNNHGIKNGRPRRYKTGHTAWNKGISCISSGSFEKGNVSPRHRPLGAERFNDRGYMLIKVNETDPITGASTRFKRKNIYLWEQANGPVPNGMIVSFIDGDKKNCELSNLMLISRAESMILTKLEYHDSPPELKPSILVLTKLKAKTLSRLSEG